MAEAFGQDPFELMYRWPERYKNLVLEWLRQQLNVPRRSDYYAMRIAQRIHQQYSKKAVSIKDQIVQFDVGTKQPLTMAERVARSKAVWLGGAEAAKKVKAKHGR